VPEYPAAELVGGDDPFTCDVAGGDPPDPAALLLILSSPTWELLAHLVDVG
jgi:hypothetical protein